MATANGHLQVGHWEETDMAHVVGVLHRSGPLSFRDLRLLPEIGGWSRQRVEHAVVSAWSANLIFIDTHDLLVAL
jgi:hypothetical protein